EAAFFTGLVPVDLGLAGHAILLGHPLAALLVHGLHGADRLADRLHAGAVASLLAFLVAGAADFLLAAFLDLLADLVAALLVAGLADRLADGAAHFLDALLAHL